MSDINETDFASGVAGPQQGGEATSSDFATSIPTASPDDFAGPSEPQQVNTPLPQNTLQEDLRRTKAFIGKVVETGQTLTAPKSIEQQKAEMLDKAQVATPLGAAFKLGGWALNQVQNHIGRHLAAGALKLAMSPEASQVAGTLGNLIGIHDSPNAPVIAEPSAESKQFAARWERDIAEGGSALHDIRPITQYPATGKEYLLRELLSTIGGNSIRLNESEALTALNGMSNAVFDVPGYGKVPLAAAVASIAHEVGGLPLFIFGTGAGARYGVAAREALAGETIGKYTTEQLAKQYGKIQTAEGAIEGAVQGGLQDTKEGNAPGAGMLGGAVFGGVLAKFMSLKGGKSEALGIANDERYGIGLPALTAEQFFREAADMSRIGPKVKKVAPVVDTSSVYPTTSAEAGSVRKLHAEGEKGAAYSFKTVSLDTLGNLYEDRIAITKKGARTVYSEPVTDKHLAEYDAHGLPQATDGEAYAELIDKVFPGKSKMFEPDTTQLKGKPQYTAPEQVDAWLKAQGVTPQDLAKMAGAKIEETPAPVTPGPRDDVPTKAQRPVILTEGEKGVMRVTPVNDGALDTTMLTPPKPKVGDVVGMPDGEVIIVDKVLEPTVAGRLRSGQKVELSAHDVSPLSRPELPPESFKFNPSATNKARKFVEGGSEHEGALLSMHVLDVPTAMKVANLDNPAEAAALLEDMATGGERAKLVKANDGKFYVRKSYEPELPEVQGKGMLVYYGTSADGRGKIGVLRGRDPLNGNKYLIEVGSEKSLAANPNMTAQGPLGPEQVYPKTMTRRIDSSEVRTLVPVLFGSSAKSKMIEQWGIHYPLPPGTVVTNQRIVDEVAEVTRRYGALSKILSAPRAVKEGIMNFIAHEAMRVPTDIRSQSITLASQKGIVKSNAASYQNELESRLGGLMKQPDKDLMGIVVMNAQRQGRAPSQREVAMAAFYQQNPKLGAEVKATVQNALDRIKQNSTFLAQNGFDTVASLEAMRSSGVEEEYVMNTYMKYMLQRKEWATFVKTQLPDVWRDAVGVVAKRHPQWFPDQVEKEMIDLMGLDIADAHAQMKTTPNGDVQKNLKHRVEMKQEIERVLGKTESAAIQVAHSLAVTDSLVKRVQVWSELQATNYWSPGPRKDLGPHNGAHVPDLPIYGKARNGYVHESLRFLVEHQPHVESGGMLRALSKYWKFNVVPAGGAAPWVSNVMRNWKGMVFSGGLQSTTDLGTFFDAADIMLKYRDNAILNGRNSLYAEAVNEGVIGGGYVGSEINKNRAANRVLNAIKMQKGKAASVWDIVSELPKSIAGGAQDVGSAYDTIDRVFKFTSYLNIRRNNIAAGMPLNDAVAMAKLRVKQSFPDYELVAPTIEKLRSGSLTGLTNFLSAKAEDMRVNATLIARIGRGELDLVGRLIGSAMTVYGFKKLLGEIRKANGISDGQVDQALNADKLSSQTYRSASLIGPEYDEYGNLTKWDISTYEDMLMMLQQHPLESTPLSVTRNLITDYAGRDTPMGQGMDQLASAAFNITPLSTQNPLSSRPGDNGVLTLLSYLAQNGGVPRAPAALMGFANKGQENANPMQAAQHPVWTPNEVLAKQLGLPFANPVGIETDTGRAVELGQNVKGIAKQMPGAVLSNTNDPQHADFLLQEKMKGLQNLIDDFQKSRGGK